MYKLRNPVQKGFGLIEALIVVLVIAVGLLALAGFEGGLMSGSGLSKAREEAMALARGKIEELRNTIQEDQYTTSVPNSCRESDCVDEYVNDSANPIGGVNAVFSRSWQIQNLDAHTFSVPLTATDSQVAGVSGGTFKEVVVRVAWQDPKVGNQRVFLNTYVAFNDPAAVGKQGPISSGSPGFGGRNPKRSGKKGPQMEDGAVLTGSATIVTGIPDIPSNSFKWQFNAKGNIVLLNASNTVLYTFYGQSLQYISGRVYYDEADFVDNNGNAEIVMFASEPAYCAGFPIGTDVCPAQGNRTTQCGAVGAYVCFFSGDCEYGDTGDLGTLDCSNFVFNQEHPERDYDDVGGLDGGWYGKVGIAGVAATSPIKTICQADVDDDNQTKSPAREYVTIRNLSGNVKKYEGINQSFNYQNYIVARLSDPLNDCSAMVNDFSYTPPDVGLPASKVRRYLSGDKVAAPNQVQALNNFWDTAVNIIGEAANWRADRSIASAAASGTNSSWPEDECVPWPAGKGFSCSVSDGWSGTITLTVTNGATTPLTCNTTVTIGSAPTAQSTKIADVTLCTP